MNTQRRLDLAKDQLDRVLGFFSRVDNKASVVLAVDTAMLGFMVSKIPSLEFPVPRSMSVVPGITILLFAFSYYCLYRSWHPVMKGGHRSLVYFKEVAKRTEANYITDFLGTSETQYTKDILGQVWRNSEILTHKFTYVKCAMVFLGCAIIPWFASLVLFTTQSAKPTPPSTNATHITTPLTLNQPLHGNQ